MSNFYFVNHYFNEKTKDEKVNLVQSHPEASKCFQTRLVPALLRKIITFSFQLNKKQVHDFGQIIVH